MGKVYVVTGGGSGIGKSVASMLPKDGTVIITGRSVEKLEKTAEQLRANGSNVVCCACDVSKLEDVRKLAEYAASLGEVDKVINCAGVSGSMGSRETIFRINCLGTVHVNREFYKVMNGGVICDIASDSADMLPKFLLPSEKVYKLILEDEEKFIAKIAKKAKILKDENANANFAYMMSKNFVRWYSSHCAFKYMAEKGIRVFSVSPGFVKTPMTDAESGDATDTMLGYAPVNRGAEPEELAYLITSLCDDRCSYLMGTDVMCDAGCVANGYGVLTALKKYDRHPVKENW